MLPSTSTTFTVIITDKYGCGDTATTTVFVETVPSISWGDDWIPYITCDGFVAPYNANVSDNGTHTEWIFGDNSTFTDYQPTSGLNWISTP
ncbi:MAG: hypothetical protein HY063_09750, partial [Bacteroidetes bacterium]|nr:hypothetical protein [Bacteroidota bacterium]